MTRQKANEELVNLLNDLTKQNPDLRFSQLIYNFGFVKANRPTKDAGDNWQNDFYTESTEILKRVKKKIEDHK